jgi:hypothetical protein
MNGKNTIFEGTFNPDLFPLLPLKDNGFNKPTQKDLLKTILDFKW